MMPINASNLVIDHLSLNDASFILELLNTPGWKLFIGERNVNDLQDAIAYVQKIIDNPNVTYFVVKLHDSNIPVGLLSVIKRDYLPHVDLGFAFLPAYAGKNYAYEAASALLKDPSIIAAYPIVLAISLKDNPRSIRLLERLGMVFDKEIVHDAETLHQFSLLLDQRLK